LPVLRDELGRLTELWQGRLNPLPEVSAVDWRRFRPLRLSREEAWSDWLAHLLEASKTGILAERLFGAALHLPRGTPIGLRVEREVEVAGGERRADLLIHVNEAAWIHVEVKVGDQGFDKTYETAALLRRDYGHGQPWEDFILLPAADEDAWLVQARARSKTQTEVSAVTWHDVARALRVALWRGGEALPWQAWAHSYCGAVEQRLLGCISTGDSRARERNVESLLAVATQVRLMKESIE
jgi:hypothetical protein